jgi:hypothetical protein
LISLFPEVQRLCHCVQPQETRPSFHNSSAIAPKLGEIEQLIHRVYVAFSTTTPVEKYSTKHLGDLVRSTFPALAGTGGKILSPGRNCLEVETHTQVDRECVTIGTMDCCVSLRLLTRGGSKRQKHLACPEKNSKIQSTKIIKMSIFLAQ